MHTHAQTPAFTHTHTHTWKLPASHGEVNHPTLILGGQGEAGQEHNCSLGVSCGDLSFEN